jgi:hypothetical protein
MEDVMGRRMLALATCLTIVGCGPDGQDLAEVPGSPLEGKADNAQSATVPTLKFDAAWQESASGPLLAGGKVAIDYDEARLPNCRASHNGNPGWQITAYLKAIPGGAVATAELFAHASSATGAPDYYSWVKQVPVLSIPAGTREVELWFKNVSAFDHPCTEWDSDYGRNYRFGVVDAGAAIALNKDWSVTRKGELLAGGSVTVSYATERMTAIANGSGYVSFFASKYHCYGYGCCEQEYQNTLHVRFAASGGFTAHPLVGGSATIALPAGASRLELYVDSDVYTTTWYCGGAAGPKYRQPIPDHFYDSNFGKNFVFGLD